MSEAGAFRWLEVGANILNLTSILLAGRNNVHTWWTGIVGCALFGTLFYFSQLYADVTLQLFFIITCGVGWIRWKGRAHRPPLPIRRTPTPLLIGGFACAVAVTLGYGAMLHFLTNAYAPYADSVVLVFSVLAQLLLIGRRLENWVFWLIVNTVAVPLYFSRGLQLTAVLYAGFWINAIVSYFLWRRAMKGDATLAATTVA